VGGREKERETETARAKERDSARARERARDRDSACERERKTCQRRAESAQFEAVSSERPVSTPSNVFCCSCVLPVIETAFPPPPSPPGPCFSSLSAKARSTVALRAALGSQSCTWCTFSGLVYCYERFSSL
jgi:hypothetical protein